MNIKKGFFWTFWVINVLVGAAAIVFFVIGLAEKSVSADNLVLWFFMFVVLAGIIGGSMLFKKAGHWVWGIILLSILALPSLLYGLLILLMVFSDTPWV